MSSNTKKSFLVYYDNEIIVCRLTDDEAGKLFKSLFPYGRDRIRPDFESSPALAMAFDVLALAIDRNDEWYKEKCNKNRENILKRWSKGDTTEYDRKQSDTTEYDRVPKDKDKDRVREEKELNDTLFNSLTLKEGDASPPSAGAGGEHPSLTDCQECADEGKVNLSEAGIKAFYNRMEKDGWKIKGKPVENLLKAMRGFAKNHKRYQKQGVSQERLQNASCIKYFKPWLQHHGYDQNYTEGSGDFDAEILVQEDIISTVFDDNEIAESMYNINERLNENGFTNEAIKPLMKLFKKYCAEKEGKS